MEGKYYKNVHRLPYSLTNANVYNIATDEKETMAVITFEDTINHNEKLIIFTENGGFEEVPDLKTLQSCSEIHQNRVLFRI